MAEVSRVEPGKIAQAWQPRASSTTETASRPLSGEIDFYVDGDVVRARPNDALHIPRGTPHAFQVASPSARPLVLGTPAGHERFFLEAGDPVDAPAAPDLERMSRAARNAGVEILGPPPFDAPAED